MKYGGNVNILKFCVSVLIIFFTVNGSLSILLAKDFNVVAPANEGISSKRSYSVEEGISTSPSTAAEQGSVADPEHFNRRGQIQITLDILDFIQSVEVGDQALFKFFEDTPFQIQIIKKYTDSINNTTIIGKILDHEMQSFVMTVGEEDFTIFLQDINAIKTYRASGKIYKQSGSVLEIDDTKRPPSYQ